MESKGIISFWDYHLIRVSARQWIPNSRFGGEVRCHDCKRFLLIPDVNRDLIPPTAQDNLSTTPSDSSDSSDDIYVPTVRVRSVRNVKQTRSMRKNNENTEAKKLQEVVKAVPNKLLRCLICPKLYKRSYDLARHVRTIHSDEVKTEPPEEDSILHIVDSNHSDNINNFDGWNNTDSTVWSSALSDETTLASPIFQQSTNDFNHAEVTCNNCNRKFRTKEALQRHVTGDRCIMNPPIDEKESITAVICNEPSEDVEDMRYSENSESSDEEIQEKQFTRPSKEKPLYKCEVCKKQFKLKESYTTHSRIHTGEKPYTCHMCGKQFSHSGGLSYHLRHVHMGIKEHACDLCGRSFALKAAMEDHRRIHTGERPYVCDACGKSFKSKASLYIHSKTHTDDFPHPCEYCQKRFRWRQQLLGHLTTHTGEKKHHCKICGKGFGVRNDLTRHERIHSDEKPFKCHVCSLPFGQKRYLKNHLKSRHGIHQLQSADEMQH